MAGFWDFLTGTESKMKPYNKDVLKGLTDIFQTGGGLENNPLFGGASNFIQSLYSNDPNAFKNFEAPYMQNFEQNIIPGIAERFAGAGTGGGAMSSSGLNQSLAQAGRNLQTDLAGLRSGLQMQGLPQALNFAQQPTQNRLTAASQIPGQYHEIPGQGGFLHNISPLAAQIVSAYIGNPATYQGFGGGGGGAGKPGGIG
jgi:hypothetical protein